MDPTPRYPLIPTVLGDGMSVRVGNVVQAILFEHISTTAGPGRDLGTTVELEPYPLTGTWRVRWPLAFGAVIGEIDAETRAEFPLVESLHSRGITPSVHATFALNHATGVYDVTVHIALAPFVVPRNNAPAEAVVLPQGSANEGILVQVAGGDYTATETMLMSPGHWLVGLNVHDETVVVTCEGRVLGTVGEHDNETVMALLDSLGEAPVFARAMAVDGSITLDIARHSTAHAVRNLPVLPVEEMPHPQPFHVFEFSDGTLAVTVEGPAAIDPDDQPAPKDSARTVAVPGAPRELLFDDAPTQYFPAPVAFTPSNADTEDTVASEESYLSEVEKVRLRRAERDKRVGDGPRHRKAD